MKKILAGLLCLVICLSSVSVLGYAEYSDVDEEYVEMIDLLTALEIMEGFDDGTFRPDSTLTRAEAAKIMVRLLGKDNWVPEGETSFTDVESTHWAAEYIYRAEANGIINGMGDGTFDPEGEVTYHQFVKMLVCVLRYDLLAEDMGGFSGGGYLYVGSIQATGITHRVHGEREEPITRLSAVQMVYNALEVELFDEWGYYAAKEGWLIDLPDSETIVENYLGCEKIEGVISKADDEKIEVEITRNYTTEERFENGQKCVFENKTRNGKELVGCTIMAYIQKSDTGNRILAVAEKTEN